MVRLYKRRDDATIHSQCRGPITKIFYVVPQETRALRMCDTDCNSLESAFQLDVLTTKGAIFTLISALKFIKIDALNGSCQNGYISV